MINIEDDILHLQRLGLLDKLLYDRTTQRNIIWGSDAHAGLGEAYRSNGEIRLELITGDRSGVIKTRARKELSQRSDRTRKNGEVFTPLWICRKMIDYADEMWHGEAEAAAHGGKITKKTAYSGSEQWRRYVDSRRLEITCGEAPYLVSRYDTVTGKQIPIEDRIGLLDRKLRVINENTVSADDWFFWVKRAYESIYGYEYQGDSLLIARVNLLYTFIENMEYKFSLKPTEKQLLIIAKIISWNIWQMDGITMNAPYSERPSINKQMTIFDFISEKNISEKEPIPCKIYDWRGKKSVEFKSIVNGGKCL